MSDEGLGLVMESALSLPVYSDLMANEDYVNTPPSADAFINPRNIWATNPRLKLVRQENGLSTAILSPPVCPMRLKERQRWKKQ